jgi:plasmid stabilization system protein ParE
MPPLPVELDPRAEEEARVAFLWYLERSERAAAAFEREIERALERIGEDPEIYPVAEGELRRDAAIELDPWRGRRDRCGLDGVLQRT